MFAEENVRAPWKPQVRSGTTDDMLAEVPQLGRRLAAEVARWPGGRHDKLVVISGLGGAVRVRVRADLSIVPTRHRCCSHPTLGPRARLSKSLAEQRTDKTLRFSGKRPLWGLGLGALSMRDMLPHYVVLKLSGRPGGTFRSLGRLTNQRVENCINLLFTELPSFIN
ncbi:hypothetical protein J6590_048968 [Homalodisca vitripennis]|nr:hypothetical protein J6590_048968 [Homalodisca vitripennis]